MAVAADYFVILVLVSAFGAFLFLASTLIFLVEEVAKYLIHLVKELAGHIHALASHPAKAPARVRSAIHNAKP
jgi:hypothetical protein